MGLLSWLMGKKETATVETKPEKPDPLPREPERVTASPPQVQPRQVAAPPPPAPPKPPSEVENLRRWKESGQPRAWVEANRGQWNHEQWLALLEELKRSSFWPMQPDAIGAMLEEARSEWLRRN